MGKMGAADQGAPDGAQRTPLTIASGDDGVPRLSWRGDGQVRVIALPQNGALTLPLISSPHILPSFSYRFS